MKYILVLSLMLMACGQRPLSILPPPDNTPLENALDAVVALVDENGDPYCSGVAIENHVLTAAHCVDDKTDVQVSYRFEDIHGIFSTSHHHTVVHVDGIQDFAILNNMTTVQPPARATIAPSAPYYGQRTIAIGHPVGLTYSVTEGIVSHPRRVWDGQVYFQTSSPLYFGNSGGPVYNKYGEVLGIASFLVRTPHLSGAIHWEVIVRELGEYHMPEAL